MCINIKNIFFILYMEDILNYAYVWYKKNQDDSFTPEESQKIYQIILDYSYPCYLGNNSISSMSPTDKTELLEHELLFIRKKFEEVGLADVNIIQIPRVLYDLFNIYYYLKDYCYYENRGHSVVKEKELLKFNYLCTPEKNENWDKIRTYSWYVNYTKDLYNSVIKNIKTGC